MSELERQLKRLVPVDAPEIDVHQRVRILVDQRRLTRARRRRRLTIAVAFATAGATAGLSVPAARSALEHLLGIRGVRVEIVKSLPPASSTRIVEGDRVSLAEARKRTRFRILLLGQTSRPQAVYVAPVRGGLVTLIYRYGRRRILLSEFPGSNAAPVYTKEVRQGSAIVPISVNGEPGLWLGSAHLFSYVGRSGTRVVSTTRLAAKTLVWQHRSLTLRLEGDFSRDVALKLAQSVG